VSHGAPEISPCGRCGQARVWRFLFSARRADDPEPRWTRHIYLCRCGCTILVLYADGRRELLAPDEPRRLKDYRI